MPKGFNVALSKQSSFELSCFCFKGPSGLLCKTRLRCPNGIHDVFVKDTLVMDILVTDISVTGRFGNRTF